MDLRSRCKMMLAASQVEVVDERQALVLGAFVRTAINRGLDPRRSLISANTLLAAVRDDMTPEEAAAYPSLVPGVPIQMGELAEVMQMWKAKYEGRAAA